MARLTVPVGEKTSALLPGSEEEKMNPWMGALEDNLEVLTGLGSEGEPENSAPGPKKATAHLIRARIKVEIAQLYARANVYEGIFDYRRSAKPHAQANENPDYPRRQRHQKWCVWATSPKSTRPIFTEGSSGLAYVVAPLSGLAAFRPHHLATRPSARGWPISRWKCSYSLKRYKGRLKSTAAFSGIIQGHIKLGNRHRR